MDANSPQLPSRDYEYEEFEFLKFKLWTYKADLRE